MDRLSVIETKCRGRMAVAISPVAAGSVVLLEDPIACVPFPTSSLSELSCTTGVHRFSQTELSLQHSKDFSKTSMFTGNMCVLAARFYMYGTCIRANNGVAMERFATIRNHMTTEQAQSLPGLHECAVLVQRLITQLQNSPSMSNAPSIAECVEVLCKLCCNLFTVTDDFQNEAGIGCYPRAALLNHSCEPNCIQRFDSQANIVIRAVCDIPAGTELTISYIDTGMPTWYRQQELLKSYYFHCTCSRCVQIDGNDAYACSNLECIGKNQHQTTKSQQNESSLPMERGTCVLSASDGKSAYAMWLEAAVSGEKDCPRKTAPAAVPLPFPQYTTLFTACGTLRASAQLTCQRCNGYRNVADIKSLIDAITDVHGRHESFLSSTEYRRYTLPEQLYTKIQYAFHALSLLMKLVSNHHYCMYHVRKQLKIAFEEHLPVSGGVLLFPPVQVRSCVANAVWRMYDSNVAAGTGENIKKNDTIVVLTSSELRQIYEDNLLAMLQIMPYCYSTTVPNLCYTFYRIQLVWYMLSKVESLVVDWSAHAAVTLSSRSISSSEYDMRNDIAVLRHLAGQSKDLLQTVKVVYGQDHAFYADMQHCAMQLQRMCM